MMNNKGLRRNNKCEVRNEVTGCQKALQNGKLEMASGKLRGFADYKCEMQSVDARCQFPDARSFAESKKVRLCEAFHPCAKHREGDRSSIN